ncbi:MAG: methionine adenosyltransferase, partial [Acholeplasmatales bacterium]|nr:methionine adenosyltransferase [Acholeplasmatales bacterium]
MSIVKYFTSESVTSGHPDKVADYIADNILDKILKKDPYSHVACEVTVIKDKVHIFGEIKSDAKINYKKVVRESIKELGYDKEEYGFN